MGESKRTRLAGRPIGQRAEKPEPPPNQQPQRPVVGRFMAPYTPARGVGARTEQTYRAYRRNLARLQRREALLYDAMDRQAAVRRANGG